MANTPEEAAFEQYKETERRALQISNDLLQKSSKLVDIEVSLIAAIFEAHRSRNPDTPPEQVAQIIQGHAQQLVPYFKER